MGESFPASSKEKKKGEGEMLRVSETLGLLGRRGRGAPTSALPVAQVRGNDEHPPLPGAHVEETSVEPLDHLVGPQSHLLGAAVVVAAGGTEKTAWLRNPPWTQRAPSRAPKSCTFPSRAPKSCTPPPHPAAPWPCRRHPGARTRRRAWCHPAGSSCSGSGQSPCCGW